MSEESTVQCTLCGRNGEPTADCDKCFGKAPTEPREYTLSEIRSGIAPKESRYGDDGNVAPRIINLPGSGGPGGQ